MHISAKMSLSIRFQRATVKCFEVSCTLNTFRYHLDGCHELHLKFRSVTQNRFRFEGYVRGLANRKHCCVSAQ